LERAAEDGAIAKPILAVVLVCRFSLDTFLAISPALFQSIFTLPNFLRLGLLSAGAFLFGICWASGFALWRMGDEFAACVGAENDCSCGGGGQRT